MTRVLASFVLAVGFIGLSANEVAAVEYTQICSLYGPGFFYIPGTDTCYNVATGDTRQVMCSVYGADFTYTFETDTCDNPTTLESHPVEERNTWNAHTTNSGRWVPNPAAGCLGGRVVSVGTFTASTLTFNDTYQRYMSPAIPLGLRTGEYIAKVMVKGGFDVSVRSSFCLSLYEPNDLGTHGPRYELLGCQDTRPLTNQSATWSLTPLRSSPPTTFASPTRLVASNADDFWGSTKPTPTFGGAVSLSVCVRNVAESGIPLR